MHGRPHKEDRPLGVDAHNNYYIFSCCCKVSMKYTLGPDHNNRWFIYFIYFLTGQTAPADVAQGTMCPNQITKNYMHTLGFAIVTVCTIYL